jgi:ATP-dependent DNA ligase
MEFPTLYGQATSGKTKMWSIVVDALDNGHAMIRTEYGYEGGKMQTQQRTLTEGKNRGKKNETTPLEQAIAEARTAWVKKTEENYAPQLAIAASAASASASPVGKAGRGKGMDADAPLPMLAHDYHKVGKKIVYPCYCQPKLDGTRCVAIPQKGLFSRRRKAYPHLEHIRADIDRFPADILLDGELYSTELTFQEIVGMVKKETLTAEEEKKQHAIQFHVYDIVDPEKTFEERFAILHTYLASGTFPSLVLVQTEQLRSEAELKPRHDAYVSAGYEGIMLRNAAGRYVNRRSNDLQKYKEFCSEEYNVIGFEEGDGAEKGCVIWVCETEEGKVFRCRPAGSREERQADFENGASFVGKPLTVKFQELTDDGIPRFPVGLAFRDYE